MNESRGRASSELMTHDSLSMCSPQNALLTCAVCGDCHLSTLMSGAVTIFSFTWSVFQKNKTNIHLFPCYCESTKCQNVCVMDSCTYLYHPWFLGFYWFIFVLIQLTLNPMQHPRSHDSMLFGPVSPAAPQAIRWFCPDLFFCFSIISLSDTCIHSCSYTSWKIKDWEGAAFIHINDILHSLFFWLAPSFSQSLPLSAYNDGNNTPHKRGQ